MGSMERFGRPDREGELLLDDPDIAGFLRGLRAVYFQPPSHEVAERHIAALAEEARDLAQAAPQRRTRIAPRFRRISAAILAALLAFGTTATALAAAGVIVLPAPARHVLERIGISLPEPGRTLPPPAGPSATPTPSERPTPSGHPSPQPTPSHPADEADPRAREGADNADDRADLRGDNADEGSQRNARGDNADDRAGNGSDNADPRGGGDAADD